MRNLITILLAYSISACAPGPAPTPPVTVPPQTGDGQCINRDPKKFVGQIANPPMGTEILAATGARLIRWVGPGMSATMDYREDRVTVEYDENRAILRVNCG